MADTDILYKYDSVKKTYVCTKCGRKFRHKDALLDHAYEEIMEETDTHRVRCAGCGGSMSVQRSVTAVDIVSHYCRTCNILVVEVGRESAGIPGAES